MNLSEMSNDDIKNFIIKEIRLNLVRSTKKRLKSLKDTDPADYIDATIVTVATFVQPRREGEPKPSFSETICKIGHEVRSMFKLPVDSKSAAVLGALLLYPFEKIGLIRSFSATGRGGHRTYFLEVLEPLRLSKLYSESKTPKHLKYPSTVRYADWQLGEQYHSETGLKSVKTNGPGLESAANNKILLDILNKQMSRGFRINKKLLPIIDLCLKNKLEAFSDIWKQVNKDAKKTKYREATTIFEMAKTLQDDEFYQFYFCDFRGRIYPSAAYLHEQSSDLARGLLLRNEKKAIGKEGFFWLMVSIANNWGGSISAEDSTKTDKIHLKDRYLWGLENEEKLRNYAKEPLEYCGWMNADKPWQFIAACIELNAVREYQESIDDYSNYEYESALECYIDG